MPYFMLFNIKYLDIAIFWKPSIVFFVKTLACLKYLRTFAPLLTKSTSEKKFWRATACRSLGNDKLVKWMSGAIWLSLTQRCSLWSSDVARSNAVALNVVLAVLRCDVSGQHLQAALCSCICRYGLTAELRHHGADVDNLSMTFLDHAWNNCLGYDEWSI